MKILVFCPDLITATAITVTLETSNHVVTDTVVRLVGLVPAIIRDIPHLLFAVGLPDEVVRQMAGLFPDLIVHTVDPQACWKSALGEAVAQPPLPYNPRRYADESRVVYHDDALGDYSKGKLHAPSQEPGWETTARRQEAFFLLQLHTAQKNHHSAKQYMVCLQEQQTDIDQEITYRIAHDSYKGLCWARDLAARWCALLAHYVHGVELDCLPSPHSASPKADHVHHDLPIWSVYALAVVSAGRPRQPQIDQIIPLSTARFDGQSDSELMNASIKLCGLAKLLQMIAECQVRLMDTWMDPARCNLPDSLPRSTHRAAGIFREFWDLTYIIHTPAPLVPLLQGFHAGTTRLATYPSIAPPFKELRRITTAAANNPR